MTPTFIEQRCLVESDWLMANTATFGRRLAELRTTKKLTQDALGRLVGVASATVSRWERGEIGEPNGSTLALLADALGVSVDRLVLGTDSASQRTLDSSTSQVPSDPLVEQVIAGEQCTDEEATALRSVNWKVAAGNYDYDFLRDFVIRRRLQAKIGRAQAPAVETKLPLGVTRLPAKKPKR